VEPAFATAGPDTRFVAAGGLVEPASEARQLAATVVGRIVLMPVEEGDRVAAGQIIAEIENADLKAQLAGARATYVARENELARLKAGAREQEIAEARAVVREAEALAAVARSNFERQSALGARGIASREEQDQALADRDSSEARRALVAERLALLLAPPRTEDLAIAQANVDAALARLAEINAAIDKTIIRSPLDGTVLKLHRRLGETVSNLPPTLVATVGDTSRLRVRADVDEADVANIAVGQTVWVTADAYTGKRFRGVVSQISGQLGRKNFRTGDPDERVDTNILEVLIDLAPDTQLPIGLPVDVRVDETKDYPTLSEAGGRPAVHEQFLGVQHASNP
jgi:HlyD family secretion protein